MTVEIQMPPYWGRMRDALTSGIRRNIHSLCGENLHRLVVAHLKRIEPLHHLWAKKLGASPTRHIDKGVEGAAWTADENGAEVVIPMPGLSRAFHDIELTTPTRHGASAYTIPVSAHAYGHRVSELVRMGWSIFRPKAKAKGEGEEKAKARGEGEGEDEGVLMGTRAGDGEAEPLYLLRKRVKLKKDRSLLPSDAEMANTVSKAVLMEIKRVTGR